ncbi:GNAT family N-acetyltransferase [Marinicrinis sediminis]|uniref:GNAT family N-acetyltransferase n=1 Tax=Marinicrinis sediminis TaxID=1652465 RepID=A0ABW5REH0_9BACL
MKQTWIDLSIQWMKNEDEAQEISRFLSGEASFDDQHHTPGELLHFQQDPLQSLHCAHVDYGFIRQDDQMAGVIAFRENEHQTGGYQCDYIVVHQHYRQQGMASALIEAMLARVADRGGRYILSYTCDLPLYVPIQQLFAKKGFERVGYCPDFYYEGEGRLTYLRRC